MQYSFQFFLLHVLSKLLICSVGIFCMIKVNAVELEMAFSHDIPPYIFQQHNNGIEIDIISAALAYKGHSVKPVYFPLGRIPVAFKSRLVDAVMGDIGVDLTEVAGHYANPAVIYDNVFLTLKNKHIKIETPKDLDNLTIISFQGAEKRYPAWLSTANQERRFKGISDQLAQVKLLNHNRYDVVLSDRYIFRYFTKQLQQQGVINQLAITEHAFVQVNPRDYRPVFRDPKIRDDFNLGLQNLKDTGQIQAIYAKYLQ
jgi:polar amino acid transport system substrate-binding protein